MALLLKERLHHGWPSHTESVRKQMLMESDFCFSGSFSGHEHKRLNVFSFADT